MTSVTDFLARRLKLTADAVQRAADRSEALAFLEFGFIAARAAKQRIGRHVPARSKAWVRQDDRRWLSHCLNFARSLWIRHPMPPWRPIVPLASCCRRGLSRRTRTPDRLAVHLTRAALDEGQIWACRVSLQFDKQGGPRARKSVLNPA